MFKLRYTERKSKKYLDKQFLEIQMNDYRLKTHKN